MREILGKNVKYHRKIRRLTQEKAAELCDLCPRYWGKIERGQVAATVKTIEKISNGLGVTPKELLQPIPEERTEKLC